MLTAWRGGSADFFGESVAIDGDRIAAGAREVTTAPGPCTTSFIGFASVFEKPASGWRGHDGERALPGFGWDQPGPAVRYSGRSAG